MKTPVLRLVWVPPSLGVADHFRQGHSSQPKQLQVGSYEMETMLRSSAQILGFEGREAVLAVVYSWWL